MKSVLIVEDDPEIRGLICLQLKREGFHVVEAASGEQALQKIKAEKYDLLIVDWMLPGLNGDEIVRALRANAIQSDRNAHLNRTPVLMVTAKSEPQDIVKGLESGADDYLTKPFDLNVLKARVRALLRRTDSLDESNVIKIGGLSINKKFHEVHCGQESVSLTLSEFKLLVALAEQRGAVLTRGRLIELIQGEGVAVIDRTVDTHVFGLRKKLGAFAELIETVRGIGYRIHWTEN